MLAESPPENPINPSHYRSRCGYEVIDVLEEFDLHQNHHRASAIAYLIRAGRKPGEDVEKDLLKAKWYIERELRLLQERRVQESVVKG